MVDCVRDKSVKVKCGCSYILFYISKLSKTITVLFLKAVEEDFHPLLVLTLHVQCRASKLDFPGQLYSSRVFF